MGSVSGAFGGGGASSLNELTNVNTGASPANNAVLVYSTATGEWGAGSIVTGNAFALNGLTDVAISNAANGQALVFNGTSWTNGPVGSAGIADDAVTSAKVADSAVGSAALGAGAVVAAKIGTGAVGSTALATGAVTTAKIAAGAVGSGKIAADAVTGDTIADNAVGAAQIGAGEVGARELSLAAGTNITFSTASNVLTINAAGGGGGGGGGTPADGSITTSKLADGAVTTPKIADEAVTTAKIDDGAVTAVKVAANTLTSTQIASGAIGEDELASNAVTGAKIADGAVGTSEIADDAVTTAKVSDGAIGSAALSDEAVTTAKISGLTGTSSGFLQADGDGTVSVGTPSGGGGLDAEGVRDTIGSAFQDGTGTTFANNDTENTMQINVGFADTTQIFDTSLEDIAVSPARLETFDARKEARYTITGYTARTSASNMPAGSYYADSGNERIYIQPQNNTHRTQLAARLLVGQYTTIEDGYGNIASGRISAVTGGAGSSPFQVNLTTPSTFAGTLAGGRIYIEGDHAYLHRTGPLADGIVEARNIRAGVIPTVPVKASKREVQLGTDDSKFVTPLQLAAQEASVLDDMTWTGFSYDADGADESTPNSMGEDVNIDYLFQFVTTSAISQAMDDRFKPNDRVAIEHDASNKIEGRVWYADRRRVGNTARWVFEFAFRGTPTETGLFETGDAITLRHESRLHGELKDEGFLDNTDLVEGTNITLTTGSDGKVTIAATATGGGSVTFATQGTANAGTSTNTVMSPATTHGLLDQAPHVAPYSGFTHTTNTGASMPLGSWNINSAGTIAHYRAHTATEHAAMFKEAVQDKRCQHTSPRGEKLEYKFSAAPTQHTIDGQTVGYIQCTIGEHEAIPANPTLTGDWNIAFMPAQNKSLFEHATLDSIPLAALAGSQSGQLKGLAATGDAVIGSTIFGTITEATFKSNSLSATQTGLMPMPHPGQASTPAGTGEVSITPRSANSTFLCMLNAGFGWIGASLVAAHFLVARKIGNGSWGVIQESKKYNVINETPSSGKDITLNLFYVDAPNTTDTVTYRWMAVRANTSQTFWPVAQSVAFLEVTN